MKLPLCLRACHLARSKTPWGRPTSDLEVQELASCTQARLQDKHRRLGQVRSGGQLALKPCPATGAALRLRLFRFRLVKALARSLCRPEHGFSRNPAMYCYFLMAPDASLSSTSQPPRFLFRDRHLTRQPQIHQAPRKSPQKHTDNFELPLPASLGSRPKSDSQSSACRSRTAQSFSRLQEVSQSGALALGSAESVQDPCRTCPPCTG